VSDTPRRATSDAPQLTPPSERARVNATPPEPRVPAELLRRVREAIGLMPPEVARVLRVGRSSYYRFEGEGSDAPPWILLALGGLGVAKYGRSVADMAALLGIDPDAEPRRTEQGTYAPVVPTLNQLSASQERQDKSHQSDEV
jgi:hypothetical protein